ncbi:MAG: hypothetical protein R3F59_17925 [Myxococcota bacterium]
MGVLARVSPGAWFADLRPVRDDPALAAWFDAERRLHGYGADGPREALVLSATDALPRAWDGVLFVPRSHAIQL